jgi:hypothetical protein
MQATVLNTSEGVVRVRVHRSSKTESLYERKHGDNADLRVGDKVEVRRQTNNPYLIRM